VHQRNSHIEGRAAAKHNAANPGVSERNHVMRKLLRKIILWALAAEQYKHDPRPLDDEAKKGS
jgi:hypothetical protein